MSDGLAILAQGLINNNLILLQGLGLYALTRWTKSYAIAARSGIAAAGTLLTASLLFWALESVFANGSVPLLPLAAGVSLAAALLWERILSSVGHPSQEGAVITGLMNSVVVGSLLLTQPWGLSGAAIAGFALAGGAGFVVVLLVMAGIRDRLDLSPVPKALQGVPILFISAALLGLALMGFRF